MFCSLKWLVFYLQGHRTLYFGLFCWKTKRSKFPIFHQKQWTNQKLWTNPFGKCKIFDFFKFMFCSVKWLDFYLQGHKTLCFGPFCWKTKRTKFQIFYENRGLTPLKNAKFFDFFKSMFCGLKWLDFCLQCHKTLLFWTILLKNKTDKISNLLSKTVD